MPTKKPLIALTGPSTFTHQCMEMIEDFLDANFVLLYHNKTDLLNFWLEQVDGVIVAGGVDIHPSIYGQSVWNGYNLGKFDIERDCRELQIVEYAKQHELPMLGICRGHQMIGLRYGLKLLMDISHSPICHAPARNGISLSENEPAHLIKIIHDDFYSKWKMPKVAPERSVINSVMHGEREMIWVNSFHHQALLYEKQHDTTKEGLTVLGTARADMQNAKEIIELMEGKQWISCQWHPEHDWRKNTASRVVLSRFKSILSQS